MDTDYFYDKKPLIPPSLLGTCDKRLLCYFGEVFSVDDSKGEVQPTAETLRRRLQLEEGANMALSARDADVPPLMAVHEVLEHSQRRQLQSVAKQKKSKKTTKIDTTSPAMQPETNGA